jgi:endonuclease/exonuclease/phosphatase family metal-dependent hydrolase
MGPPKKQPRLDLKSKLIFAAACLMLLAGYVLNASKPGRAVEGCLEGCAEGVAVDDGEIRIVSLNMLHGFPDFDSLPRRLELIAAGLQELEADIVLLQEVPWTVQTGSAAKWLAEALGFNYAYYRANGNKGLIAFEEGEAVLSRFPLKAQSGVQLPPRVSLFESRVALAVTVVTPWGDAHVVVTHLTDKDPTKDHQQALALMEFVDGLAGEVKVVGGDFNAQPDSEQIRTLAGTWRDPFVGVTGEAAFTCCADDLNALAETLEKRIDYLFLAGREAESIQILRTERVFDEPIWDRVNWQWVSDHVGLMVVLEKTDIQ